MGRRRWFFLALLCALILALSCTARAELEGIDDDDDYAALDDAGSVLLQKQAAPEPLTWDEDEFEGFEKPSPPLEPEAQPQPEVVSAPRRRRRTFVEQDHYWWELAGLVGITVYVVNIFVGKRKNERTALAWAKAFALPGGVMDRNFALVGAGDKPNELLMKESNASFKFYASGRRHCQSLVATLDLRARHDLLKLASYVVMPRTDVVNVEVQMNEASMPPIVLAVATPGLLRAMRRQYQDLEHYTKQISVPKNRLAWWPSKELQVLTEHSSVFYDLFSDPRIEAVFSGPPDLPLFRSLHFTSETPYEGGPRRMLRFSFHLPPEQQMAQLGRLLAVVTVFVDVLGGYKMAAEVQKKAAKARADLAERAFKDKEAQRQEAVQQRKLQKIQEQKERLKAMSPEARAKWLEKQEKAAAKSRFRFKTIK